MLPTSTEAWLPSKGRNRHHQLYAACANTRRIPLTFAPEEPNAESLEAIREGDAFLSAGKKGRFANGADLIAAAMA